MLVSSATPATRPARAPSRRAPSQAVAPTAASAAQADTARAAASLGPTTAETVAIST